LAVTVRVAGIDFDRVSYYRDGDVLYLSVGRDAPTDWDESAEGDGVSYGRDGSIVGLTILNARKRLEREGKIVITLPQQRVEATDLDEVLAPA
jgi:uncharacterized protein YuzE